MIARICAECAHAVRIVKWGPGRWCCTRHPDVVTGRPGDCYRYRARGGECGPEGAYYEERKSGG